MGLNDAFIIDDSAETPPATTTVNALKDTVPGQMPEELEGVTLIAVEDEPEDTGETNEEEVIRVATEELHIRIRDLQLLQETLVASKGMSQIIAMECQHTLPNFVGDVRPMGSFTSSVTKVHYQAALEEVDNEKKGVLQKIKAFVQDLIKSLIARVKRFFGKVTPAEVKEKVRETPSLTQRTLADYEKIHKEEKYRNITTKALAVEMRKAIGRNSLIYIQIGGNEKYAKLMDNFVAAAEGVAADTFLSGGDKDEFFVEAEKTISEITQEAAVLGEEEDNLYTNCAESLYARGDRLYGSAALAHQLSLTRISDGLEAALEKASKNVAASEDSEAIKTIQKRVALASRYSVMIAQIGMGYFTYFKYYKVGKFIAVAEQAAMRQLGADKMLAMAKDPEAAMEAFQGAGDGVAPNGAITPMANYAPGGFAEYFFEIKGAETLHGAINAEGGISSDPKKELLARIRTLQEALARIEAKEAPSMESIDIVTDSMLPKESLNFQTKAARGEVDKEAYKAAIRREATPILTGFQGRLDALGLKVAEGTTAMADMKKFGLFSSKAATRNATPEDIAAWMKIADQPTSTAHAWAGMPENAKMIASFVSEALDLTKTDIFYRSFWNQFSYVDSTGKNFLNRFLSERVEEHDIAAKVVVSGIFGNISGFFKNAEDVIKNVDRCYGYYHTFIEQNLKRYIVIATEKDLQSDLSYFQDVLAVMEWIINLLGWIISVYYSFVTSRKKFLTIVNA